MSIENPAMGGGTALNPNHHVHSLDMNGEYRLAACRT